MCDDDGDDVYYDDNDDGDDDDNDDNDDGDDDDDDDDDDDNDVTVVQHRCYSDRRSSRGISEVCMYP